MIAAMYIGKDPDNWTFDDWKWAAKLIALEEIKAEDAPS